VQSLLILKILNMLGGGGIFCGHNVDCFNLFGASLPILSLKEAIKWVSLCLSLSMCCNFIRQVALVDYGSEITVGEKDMWALPSSCAMTPGFALRCHLADIMPAGDITKWSRTACETLQSKLKSPAVCFLAPKVLCQPFKHFVRQLLLVLLIINLRLVILRCCLGRSGPCVSRGCK